MKIEIKKAQKKDFGEITEIYTEEFSKHPYNEPWTREKAIEKMKIFSKYCEIWKIISENKIAGFLVINPYQWCPGECIFGEVMAVKSELQNKGIGEKTWELIFEEYQKRGFKTFIGIQNRNSKVKNIYKRIGMKESQENFVIGRSLE